MLSKVLATLVATMAVGFAGYTLVSDSSSHCCSGTMAMPAVSSDSCCESAAALPSCCNNSVVTPEAACQDTCPADKVAVPAKDKTPDANGDK
jgi:hypothetical protein